MNRPNPIYVPILMAILVAGCQPGNGTIKIEIAAKTAENTPVSGATVTLDDEQIGQTNAFGTFSSTVSLPASGRHKITIAREDSTHYYAPHFETFKLSRGDELILSIKPVLYVVPKPRSRLAVTPQKFITTSSEAATNTTKSVAANEEDNSKSLSIPLIALSERDLNTASQSPEETTTPNETPAIFTTHVYAGRGPLSDATVTFTQANGLELGCRTNDRGRCVITVQEKRISTGSLLLQHPGFKSVLRELTPKNNANIRFSMEPGLTIDIKSVANGPWSSSALPGAEVRLRGATVGITNAQGLAVISPENILPVTLRVESPLGDDAVELSVSNATEAKVLARFSSDSKDGWNQWRMFRLHEIGDVSDNIPTASYMALETSLYRDSPAVKENLDVSQFSRLPTGTLALLPVTELSDNRVSLSLYALDSSGVLAVSKPALVKSPFLAEAWASAGDEVKESLLSQLPWPGAVSSANKGLISVAMNPKYVHINDVITIDADNGKLAGKVVSIAGKHIAVRLADIAGSSRDNRKIIGAPARKIIPLEPKLAHQTALLSMLKPVIFDRPEIRLAKKYLAENNPDAALKALSNAEITGTSNILVEQMMAAISQGKSESVAVVHDLYDILRLTTASGLTFATLVTEANLIRAQTDALLVIAGNSDLINRLDELGQRALVIKTDLQSKFTSRLSDSSIIATLIYTRLVASRKKAECEGDEVTLATLGSQWDDFEKSLPAGKLQKIEHDIWSRTISRERARVSMVPVNDKKSL